MGKNTHRDIKFLNVSFANSQDKFYKANFLGSATDLDDSIGTSSKSVQRQDLDFELFISF
jgi:hypothetical protein